MNESQTSSPFDMQPQQDLHRCHGARPIDGDATAFTVWAPLADQVFVDLVGRPDLVAMQKDAKGYHHATVKDAKPGDRYLYRIREGPGRPDPASRFQPQGVHGPSEIISADFNWTDRDWRGPILDELIIYELHLGTFTREGTFQAAASRLAELVELGVSAIELMPVAASAGRWNWGYDGVALFAPAEAYGTPDDFRRFVDAAHSLGLSVFLDVVYNHLGPEGNYLGGFGPYLSTKHHTVWGEAPNFDDPEHGDSVRRFFIANALHWLDEYHLDGLRVDAIHCMEDDRDPHVVTEMAEAVDRWSRNAGRRVMMIAESNVYDPEMTLPRSEGGIGFDAMWCDDFLHSLFAVLRPGEQLCHRPYHSKTDLEHTLRHGYVYEGTLREERRRTTPSHRVDSRGLVYSIQNHDFIGNHPLGKRLHQLTSDQAHRAAAALMILSPAIPMMFMGEEFACQNPFCFFVDFSDPELRKAVSEGRRREYPQHDWSDGVEPTDPEAFLSAKIGAAADGNADTLRWYRDLIATRKHYRASGLLADANLTVSTDLAANLFSLRYDDGKDVLSVLVRLAPETESIPSIKLDVAGELILDSMQDGSERSAENEGRLLANHAMVFRGK